MTACDFATCNRDGTVPLDGWNFCDGHASYHHRLAGQYRGVAGTIRLTRPIGHLPNSALTRAELIACLEHELTRPIPPPRFRPICAEGVRAA